jgi:CDGSH-type Zn-finger protein
VADRQDGARQVVVTADGPVLLTGPVEIVLPDGRRVRSDRPVTALCVCRRSKRAPFCDTSHRRKVRTTDDTAHDAPNDSVTNEETRAQPHRTATG